MVFVYRKMQKTQEGTGALGYTGSLCGAAGGYAGTGPKCLQITVVTGAEIQYTGSIQYLRADEERREQEWNRS